MAAFVAAGACLLGTQADAHHSFPGTYLEDRTITIEGELVQILFRNPHSFVHMMVKEKDGSIVRYAIEWVGASELGHQGVTATTLRNGDYVVISGSPGRNAADHRVRMLSLQRPKDGFGWRLPADRVMH
ncbi:MAG: hypothetical protein HY824_15675 [Acidobacteria bacterium]|nr:hypothetical protein [Acidobacteriota bacterium]